MNRRIAIVTGVSRVKGIGKAICIELAKNDIDIFFTYWRGYDQQMPKQQELPIYIKHFRVSPAF